MSDKKISELPAALAIKPTDISVLISDGTDYQFAFTTLLQLISSNLTIGANITFGVALPANITGKNGDVFINTGLGSFAQKIAGIWTIVYTLPTSNGSTDGTVLYGLGIPGTSIGVNDDTYINTGTGIFYKKFSGLWNQVFSMQTGPAGVAGIAGTNGTNGTNGLSVLSGIVTPSNLNVGINGDFYINTNNYTLFGPKTSGDWGKGVSLIGDPGPIGNIGPMGLTGTMGPKGDKGSIGEAGVQGERGVTGLKGDTGLSGIGVIAGGSLNQVLAKKSETDYDTKWITFSGGGSPGGSDNQLQYNESGAFAGSSKFTFDDTTLNLNNAPFYLGNESINASAVLQVDSTTHGFLPPRMTESQRIAMPTPAIGLLVYQTNTGNFDEGLYQFKSTGWVSAATGVAGSDTYIQFNDGGSIGASSNFVYNKEHNAISVGAPYNGFDGSFAMSIHGTLRTDAINMNSSSNSVFTGFQNNYPYLDWVGITPRYGHTLLDESGGFTTDNSSGNRQAWLYAGSGGKNWNYVTVGNSDTSISSAGNINFLNGWAPNQQTVRFSLDNSIQIQSGGVFNDIASAILQVNSTTRGILMPRMTTDQKMAIASPLEGLEIYDLTLHKKCIYTGNKWETIASS
jgi:hypothetical protein